MKHALTEYLQKFLQGRVRVSPDRAYPSLRRRLSLRVRKPRLQLLAVALVFGTIASSSLIPTPAYAAPEDHGNQAACEEAGYAWEDATCVEAEETASSCVVDGVGWIVCAVAVFLAEVTDEIYGLIESMLVVPAVNTDTSDGTNGMYNAWSIMRTFANVAFVIAFMIIIYSQLTSTGITNYGVKKLLPRIIIAAILVNLSFYIAAAAVDVSNILGAGLYQLLSSVKNSMNIGISENWGNIIAALLAGQAIAISGGVMVVGAAALAVFAGASAGSAGIMAVLFMALPILLGAVLAVLVVLLLLVARQALVVILIIVSPLAFVAYLLPNTEKLFKQWRQMLMTMLTMYPIISIIFGGAQIAGLAILSTAENADNPLTAGVAIVTGQAVMVIPFFMLFGLIKKFSGSQLESMAAKFQAKGKSAIGGVSKLTRPIANRKLGLAKGRLQTGQFSRRFGRNGRETLTSRLGRAAGGAVGGGLNFLGRSKYADEKLTQANEANAERAYAESNAGQAAVDALKTAQMEKQISETAADTRFEATAPLELKLRAKLAKDQLELEKSETNRAGVEAAALYARGDHAAAAAAAGGDLRIAHGLDAAHTAASVSSSATDAAKRVQQQAYAQELSTDPAMVAAAAGIGGAAAESRVLASAQHTLQKAVADDVDAERSSVANMTDMNALKAEFNAAGTSAARKAALAERAITIGDPEDYHDMVDTVGTTTGKDAETNVMRQTVAKAVAANSQLFKAADIDAIATGTLATRTSGANTVAQTVSNNVENGVLSAEKMVSASNGDLKFAHANASPAGEQRLRDTAIEVHSNETLRGKIKHNAAIIDNISRGVAP